VYGVPLHQPGSASVDEARGDWLAFHSWPGGYRRCSGSSCTDHLPVCWHLHQGSSLLDLLGVSVQPQCSQWLVVAAGGLVREFLSLLASLVHSCAGCLRLRGAASVYMCEWPLCPVYSP
jgi:hypothetical protein